MAYTFFNTYKVKGKNIYGATLNNYEYGIDVYIEQSNAVNNYTNVKTVAWVMMSAGGTTTSSTYYFKENNVTYQNLYIKLGVNDSSGYATPYHCNEKISTYYHNADGTKSITLNFSVETEVTEGANANLNNYCFKSASITQTITLPTINRVSPFSFSGSFTMGSSKSITISPYVSNFTHTVAYSFGNTSGNISTNATTSASWTPSKELGKQIPNATSGVGTLTVTTYNGSTKIGSTSKQFTLNVASDMQPTFSYTCTQNNAFNGLLLTTRSTSTFAITNATGSYGSTIKSYSISGEGLNTTSSSGTTSVYSSSGAFTYTLKVTDSRGRTATQTKSVNVYAYAKPSVTVVSRRCNNSGTLDEQGNFASVNVSWNIANPNNANKNNKTISIYYKLSTASSWSQFYSGTLSSYKSNQNFTNNKIILDSSKSYNIRVTIKDSFNEIINTSNIATATCILDIEPSGLGVGKYYQHGALDIMGDIYVDGSKFYETGTFSPSFYCSDGCSMSFTRRQATYEKIGKWCMCNISLVVEYFNPGNTPSNQFEVINLPFTNKGIYSAVTIGYCSGINTTYDIKAYIRPNGSSVAFVYRNGSGIGTITGNHVLANLDVQLSFMYQVEE